MRHWIGLIGVLACGGGQAGTEVVMVEEECFDCVPAEEVEVVDQREVAAEPVTGRPPIRMLAAGNQHTCALTEDGVVHCWGSNNRGQLGDADVDQVAAPLALAGMPEMDAVWAGYEMTCARAREGGRVTCWGETGLEETNPIALDGVTNVTLGPARGCLRNDAGELHCWGDYGRPHGPIWSELTKVDLGAASSVALSWVRGCASAANGRVRCWGQVPPYVAIERHGDQWSYGRLTDVAQLVFADGPQVLPHVVDRRGRVFATELGDTVSREDSRKRLEKRRLDGLEGVAELVAGGGHHCALQRDGRAACWGLNTHGQVGAASEEERIETAAFVSLNGVEQIVAGGGHSCARTADALHCWGANDHGQLGVEEPRRAAAPVPVPW